MAYNKTIWVDNNEPFINAENLNKIENGIANAIETDSVARLKNVISNNLFDKNYKRRNTAYRIETLNTGVRVYYGADTSAKWANSGIYLKNVQDLLGKTFTFSSRIVPSGNNNGYIAISEYSFDGVHQRNIAETATGNVTFTFPSSLTSASNQICVNFYSNFNSENAQPYDYVDYFDVMLEEGETAISYAPYLNLEEAMQENEFYSASEVRIGTFLGKSLYRKVVSVTPTAQYSTGYTHGIDQPETFVKVYGTYKRTNSDYRNAIPSNYTNWEVFLYDVRSDAFTMRFSDNVWSSGVENCYIVFEYTKTTD